MQEYKEYTATYSTHCGAMFQRLIPATNWLEAVEIAEAEEVPELDVRLQCVE